MRNTKPSNSNGTSQSKKSRSPHHKKKSLSSPATESTVRNIHSDDDIKALEAFCASVEFSEITISEWEHGFENLDIIVPVWITIQDAKDGCEINVTFTRSVRIQKEGPIIREKGRLLIQIPRGSRHQSRVLLSGKGDIRGGRQGDLIILIHLK